MGRIAAVWNSRQRQLLHELIRRKGLETGEYALFDVTGEGKLLPMSQPGDEVEEASGLLLDRSGRVFAFWLGWDEERQEATLTDWEEVPVEPHWCSDPEYQNARRRVGLPAIV